MSSKLPFESPLHEAIAAVRTGLKVMIYTGTGDNLDKTSFLTKTPAPDNRLLDRLIGKLSEPARMELLTAVISVRKDLERERKTLHVKNAAAFRS